MNPNDIDPKMLAMLLQQGQGGQGPMGGAPGMPQLSSPRPGGPMPPAPPVGPPTGPVPYQQNSNYVPGMGVLPQGISPQQLAMLKGAPNMNGYHDS